MRRLWSFQHMRASTRFLVVSGVAIGVLVVVTVVLVLTVGEGSTTLLPEDAPEGVVQRYLLALEAGDYEEAYGYLSLTARAEESYLSWVRPLDLYYAERPGWNATLGESWVVGNTATVEVTFTFFQPRGLFDITRTYHLTFRLEKEGTSWGITSPTWLNFLYY
ncbi:MAG TPA: hypothetical protein G4O10_06950 [Dehalococcoidia bacterium]|nr:hypothetical protein [Dehalococcoidia bacterium]